jgi:hypothetical protein
MCCSAAIHDRLAAHNFRPCHTPTYAPRHRPVVGSANCYLSVAAMPTGQSANDHGGTRLATVRRRRGQLAILDLL